MITPYESEKQVPQEVRDEVERRVYLDERDETEMALHLFFRSKADWSRSETWERLKAAWLHSEARDIESENPWHKLHTKNYWVYYRKDGSQL